MLPVPAPSLQVLADQTQLLQAVVDLGSISWLGYLSSTGKGDLGSRIRDPPGGTSMGDCVCVCVHACVCVCVSVCVCCVCMLYAVCACVHVCMCVRVCVCLLPVTRPLLPT